ncbi:hypothetical protein [Bradyrhizobium sp. sBnM-33]|uniref:hypothetical protein n=1 Tax=Bradyrhizobium sp. sBnM-33 TaxID=2831780 RepID=UPI001BCAF014|nr:hypothetical protein [Bradyrhizobium sp. sBnM-33]WOH53263.1 hypothetical protein RX328_14955 [Bradyrhizobium sp. sBnM-33]
MKTRTNADPNNVKNQTMVLGAISVSDVVKFTALASLLAIFMDAAIAHAMLWGNDPYWTYWLTDTLLMATVFGLGTAWLGIGLVRGAALTTVHMVLLTTFYWSISPVGLPSHPEWLDLEHTWITGLPAHFAVYYLGYVVALWLWQRRASVERIQRGRPFSSPARLTTMALVVSVGVVIVVGALQTLVLHDFPGVAWFVVRVAIAFPFTLSWWVIAGTDRTAAIGGGIMTGLLLTTYSHFLGPNGLPNQSFRLLAENPPPAVVHWLSYRQEFLVILPITVIVAVAGYLIATSSSRSQLGEWGCRSVIGAVASLVALLSLGIVAAAYTGPEANSAVVSSKGIGGIGQTAGKQSELTPTSATLRMSVENRNTHRTPLPPHDRVAIDALVPRADGTSYRIVATEPMVSDPQGRFTTWAGVGFDVWHHGRSGIGVATLPPTKSNVAVYALGNVSANGRLIAAGVPVHVMTTSREGARLEMHVGDQNFPLPAVSNGYLRVVWPDYEGGYEHAGEYARYAWGSGVLVVLLLFALAAARRSRTMKEG